MTAAAKRELKAAPKNRALEISAARKAAFDILVAIERGQSHSDDLLRGKAVSALSPIDRNLATALVLGVLRWQLCLDQEIRALLARPNARLDSEVLIALRLAAMQILLMDRIPPRAAIDESVELAKQAGHRFASGMVNAVLRKLAAPDARAAFAQRVASGEAQEQAHPTWMVERWKHAYGAEIAQRLCAHGQSQAASSLRLAAADVEQELGDAGIVLAPSEFLSTARCVVSGDMTATPAYREGRARIQDEGSQLIAEIAAAAVPNAKTILDACAAPGGKTLIFAERNALAHIVACESSEPRFEALRARLAGLGDRIECRLIDATTLEEGSAFDLALVDAPCSGTGTLGRNPEIRHRLKLDDLDRQTERQRSILRAALRAVRPGGRVVYSTCSLEVEENEQVVAAVLAETPGAQLVSLAPCIESLGHFQNWCTQRECNPRSPTARDRRHPDSVGNSNAESALERNGILVPTGAERLHDSLTPEGALRLLPGDFSTDGFFVALIERVV